MKLNAMALTAGTGSRLVPFTLSLAKPAIPFFGVPMVYHALRHLQGLDINTMVANLHHRPDDIKKVLSKGDLPYKIIFSDEVNHLLGTGGGVSKAREHLETADHFLIFNGDEVFLPTVANFLSVAYEQHRQNKNLATLITINHKEVGLSLGGAWVDENNQVVRFSKKKVAGLSGLHYIGYAFLSRNVFKYFSEDLVMEDLLYETLTKAMAVGERVYAFKTNGLWYETGNAKSFLNGTEKLIDQLKFNNTTEWAKTYIRFLQKHKPFSYVVEKLSPDYEKSLQQFLNSI